MLDIYYCGVVVQPTGQYAQDTGFETESMQFFLLCWVKGYERIFKDIGKALAKKAAHPKKAAHHVRINTKDINGYIRITYWDNTKDI